MNKKIDKQILARELRLQGKSVNVIAKELIVSQGSVSLWVKDIVLTDEQKIILKNNQGLHRHLGNEIFKQKTLAIRNKAFIEGRKLAEINEDFRIICSLYWAEGNKTRSSIGFTNSDPDMILIFYKIIKKYLNIKPESFRIYCQIHGKDSVDKNKDFWLNLLELNDSNWTKPTILEGCGGKKNRLKYGICRLSIHNVQKFEMILGGIDYIKEFYKNIN